jgi:ABC-type amino acid transport substrate-binding protein
MSKSAARSGLFFLAFLASQPEYVRAALQDQGQAAVPRKVLVVCATPGSMPRTGKAPNGTAQGLDVAVALSVGRVLGREIEFHWCASAGCSWHCLPEGRCDVVAGQPLDSGPAGVAAWSVPYAGAQFGLVVPRGGKSVHSLAELSGKRIGIVAGTVDLSDKDHIIARFKSREALLDSFEAAQLDGAFLDADFAAWYLREYPRLPLRLVPEYVPREHWNMALAVRARDHALLLEINRALAQLAASGEIRKVYADQGVPYHPPFANSGPRRTSADTWRRAIARGELVVSMDPANLPYSSAKDARPGIDVDLSHALAQKLQVKLRIDWLDVQHETAMGELLEDKCDLVLGEAVADNRVADDEELAGKILYSRPYYGTGYVLVRRKNGPEVQSLKELQGPRSQRLGTEAGSIADYRLRQRGYLRQLFRNQLATLKALSDGAIDYAYLWANAGWLVHTSPELNVELVTRFEPVDHWNIAVAMRRGDNALKDQVDAALGALIADGTVARVLTAYHVPYFPPFPELKDDGLGSRQGLVQPDVTSLGPKPAIQKIQTSKHGYHGLAKVRSAGELVVGLDQNNLPFSTAHPQPSGLDHEIASLLAEQLGVRLRIYWAYSSHDSYPSKLSSKELCDVILGVMPDDRFGKRVLYSRPYYHACYLVVVRPGDSVLAENEALAVEAGLAVRGLKRRPTHSYPSTEAVLEAVATGQEKAGYVISTRAPWLAEKLYPGKLAFLDVPASGSDSVDRFPIVAAVRKSDPDLKDAIDRAWDNLDQSGRLAQVFGRWHIPYRPVAAVQTQRGPAP